MSKEEVIAMIKKAFGSTMEDSSIVYTSKAYDYPIYFTPNKNDLTIQAGGLEFDVPYDEIESIEDYPGRSYIRMKHHNRVRTYVVWR